MILQIQGVPDELQREFKILCLQRGSNMKEQIIKYMKEEVEKATRGKP